MFGDYQDNLDDELEDAVFNQDDNLVRTPFADDVEEEEEEREGEGEGEQSNLVMKDYLILMIMKMKMNNMSKQAYNILNMN